jgi:hypothetical protein
MAGLMEYSFWINEKGDCIYLHVDKINYMGSEDCFTFGDPVSILQEEAIRLLLVTMREYEIYFWVTHVNL